MEEIKIVFHDKEENYLLNYFSSKILKNDIEIGSFINKNDILKIEWLTDYNIIYNEFKIKKILENEEDNNISIWIPIYKININGTLFNLDEIKYNYENNDENGIFINLEYYQLDNDIYVNKTNDYFIKKYFKNISWEENCFYNTKTKYFYRESNIDENGFYDINNDNIFILNWTKWNPEKFVLRNDIYQNILFETNNNDSNNKEIYIYHKDWNDICIINENKIYKKNDIGEYGKYESNNNKLSIKWEKWNEDIFYLIDNIYYHEKLLLFIEFDNKYIGYNNKLYYIENSIYYNDYLIDNENFIIDETNYFYKKDDNNIILYKNKSSNIQLYKEGNAIVYINNDDSYIETKNNIYGKLLEYTDKILVIKWDTEKVDKYENYNDIYYNDKYLELNNRNVLFFINNNYIQYEFSIFNNYFLNENEKIYYLEDNLEIYYILKNKNIEKYHLKVIDSDIVMFNENIDIDYDIYTTFNNETINMSKLDIYKHYFMYKTKKEIVYNISSFLEIYNLTKLDKKEDIIKWYQNEILDNKFYGNNEYYEICHVSKNNDFLSNNLFIIDLDNLNYLENIIDNIPKISHIIITIPINIIIKDINDYILSLRDYIKNLIIIKYDSNKILKYYFINDILINKCNTYNKVIYIRNNIENLDDVIINMNRYDLENRIYRLKDNIMEIENIEIIDNNYMNYLINNNDILKNENKMIIIYILIIYYIKNKKIFEYFDDSLIFLLNNIKYII